MEKNWGDTPSATLNALYVFTEQTFLRIERFSTNIPY